MFQRHGGDVFTYPGILDLSANLSPLGMPESVKKAVRECADSCAQYPDPLCRSLREKLSVHEDHPAEKIVCGNGADDLIYRAVHSIRPARAVIAVPCFSEYEKALSETGCDIIRHLLREDEDFLPGPDILDALTADVDMLMLCTPNNPTGQLIQPELLAAVARRCEENDIVFLCDECFIGFAENGEEYSLKRNMNSKTIVLRAFTKLYAMAGLRLGYALCGSSSLAEKLRDSGQYWSVSAPAQAGGEAALSETDYPRRAAETVAGERRYLTEELVSAGFKVYPSSANYILFRAGEGLAERLLKEGIMIRCCGNYAGLDGTFYRTAVRRRQDSEQLLKALRRCING